MGREKESGDGRRCSDIDGKGKRRRRFRRVRARVFSVSLHGSAREQEIKVLERREQGKREETKRKRSPYLEKRMRAKRGEREREQ